MAAGARKVYLIEEPMAAAIGAGLPVSEPTGSMVVDIGGGTTGIATLSLGGIVDAETLTVAGYRFDEVISAYIRRAHNVAVGERTAERIKIDLGSALEPEDGDGQRSQVKGFDLAHGIPRAIEISEYEIWSCLAEPMAVLIDGVKQVLENTAPELSSDISDRGITLTGGGALFRRLDELLTLTTGLSVKVAERPLACGVMGAGAVLEGNDPLGVLLEQ